VTARNRLDYFSQPRRAIPIPSPEEVESRRRQVSAVLALAILFTLIGMVVVTVCVAVLF
jgi:hypothetical protein